MYKYALNHESDEYIVQAEFARKTISITSKVKKKSFNLTISEKEAVILEAILNSSGPLSPVSARDIEEYYLLKTGIELHFNSLKNTIASLRKKFHTLLTYFYQSLPYKSDRFIVNMNRKGYFWVLSEAKSIPRLNREQLSIRPPWYRTYAKLFALLSCNIRPSNIIKTLSLPLLLAVSVYALQALLIVTMFNSYSMDATSTLLKFQEFGCEKPPELLYRTLRQGKNIDSVYYISNTGSKCFINPSSILKPSQYSFLKWFSNHKSFFYTKITSDDSVVWGRFTRSKIHDRYKLYMIPYLTDRVRIYKNGRLLSTFDNTESTDHLSRFFKYNVKNSTSIELFSDDLYERFLLFLLCILALQQRKSIISLTRLIAQCARLEITLDPIIDRATEQVLYYELQSFSSYWNDKDSQQPINSSHWNYIYSLFLLDTISNLSSARKVGFKVCSSIFESRFKSEKVKKTITKMHQELIVLELSEQPGFHYNKQAIERIHRLKNCNHVKIAMTDFGVEHNYIQNITKIKPEYVKTNRLLTCEGVEKEHKSLIHMEILSSLLSVCNVYDIFIIYTGVDNEIISNSLLEMEGYYQQGKMFNA